jgi:hypothetical protein
VISNFITSIPTGNPCQFSTPSFPDGINQFDLNISLYLLMTKDIKANKSLKIPIPKRYLQQIMYRFIVQFVYTSVQCTTVPSINISFLTNYKTEQMRQHTCFNCLFICVKEHRCFRLLFFFIDC